MELKPESLRVIGSDACTHTHTQNAEKSSVPVQQHFVLLNPIHFSISLPLFYSPRREAVTTSHVIFILYPFGQRYASISFLLNACYLGFLFSRLVPIYVHYNKTCAHE